MPISLQTATVASATDSANRFWTTPDGRRVALHGRQPLEEAERQLAGIVGGGWPDHVVVIGLGLGYVLDAIERWPVATRVLALEPDMSTLPAMMRRRDWRPWLDTGRLQIITGPGYANAIAAWHAFGATELPPVTVLPAFAREMSPQVLRARMVFDQMRFRTPLDPREPRNGQSMLHHTVLMMLEHLAATTPAAVLEIGAYIGGSTMAICRGIRQSPRPVPFWSVELGGAHTTHPDLPSADIFGDLQRNLRTRSLDRFVTLLQGYSTTPEVLTTIQAGVASTGLSMLSIDADGEVQRDFDNYLHLCRPGCMLFVDDYRSEHVPEKVAGTQAAVDRMVAAGVLESGGVHGWGTWVGRVVQTPRKA